MEARIFPGRSLRRCRPEAAPNSLLSVRLRKVEGGLVHGGAQQASRLFRSVRARRTLGLRCPWPCPCATPAALRRSLWGRRLRFKHSCIRYSTCRAQHLGAFRARSVVDRGRGRGWRSSFSPRSPVSVDLASSDRGVVLEKALLEKLLSSGSVLTLLFSLLLRALPLFSGLLLPLSLHLFVQVAQELLPPLLSVGLLLL